MAQCQQIRLIFIHISPANEACEAIRSSYLIRFSFVFFLARIGT
jgi:hypothetical protein